MEAGWCGDAACEARVKEETKATIRLLPLDEEGHGRCSVRGLRKERSRHRGLRPGVLILGPDPPLAALAGCSGRAPELPLPRTAPHWLQLLNRGVSARRGSLVRGGARGAHALDGAVAGGRHGLPGWHPVLRRERFGAWPPSDAIQRVHSTFDYHADPLIFAHRTITTLVPRAGIARRPPLFQRAAERRAASRTCR